MQDLAFLSWENRRFLCAEGPFESAADPGDHPTAFYWNDFQLTDPEPWKIPSRSYVTEDPRELLGGNGPISFPAIEWEGVPDGDFRRVFDAIQDSISAGTLQKSVPVITERGRLRAGSPAALIRAVRSLPHSFCSYGYRHGDEGMVGATPERLFSLSDGVLQTMALAGTAPRHEAAEFLNDSKEIEEHEFVADYLVERLSPLGEVKREPRQMMDLGPIVHFHSSIRVQLDNPNADLNQLIARLHPTPALGAYPRGEGALRQLWQYREQLGTPGAFGAPFGARHEGHFHGVVSIRNISWSGDQISLPSGAGIIRASRFDREWRELSLKRNSVKALLGV